MVYSWRILSQSEIIVAFTDFSLKIDDTFLLDNQKEDYLKETCRS